jgi:hypothetical protein
LWGARRKGRTTKGSATDSATENIPPVQFAVSLLQASRKAAMTSRRRNLRFVFLWGACRKAGEPLQAGCAGQG